MSLLQMVASAYENQQAEAGRLASAYEQLLLEAEALRQDRERLRQERDALVAGLLLLLDSLDRLDLAGYPDIVNEINRARRLAGHTGEE